MSDELCGPERYGNHSVIRPSRLDTFFNFSANWWRSVGNRFVVVDATDVNVEPTASVWRTGGMLGTTVGRY